MKSTTQSGLWKVGFGELGATLKALQDYGVTLDYLARLRAEPDYAKQVAEFMLRGDFDSSIKLRTARSLLGNNIFDIADWKAFYNVKFTKKQLREIAEFPWGEDILNSTCPLCGKVVKDCHFAFVGLNCLNGNPLTILKLQELHPATGKPKFCSYDSNAWYSEHKFAKKTTMSSRWYLLHQKIVPKSDDKTYNDQKAMLTADYEVPSAVTSVTQNLLIFRKTGNFVDSLPFYGRCECVASNGNRVYLRHIDGYSLHVDCYGDGPSSNLGVAASRKF